MLRFPLLLSAGAICAGAVVVASSSANAAACKAVRGLYQEIAVTGPQCLSPVGLCTAGHLIGPFKGDTLFTASNIISSSDTPTTGVVFVTGDTIVTGASFEFRQGTLSLKNAAAFHTVFDGNLTDTQVIVGGTDGFAGASGSLRAQGTVDSAGAGSSTYEGYICFP